MKLYILNILLLSIIFSCNKPVTNCSNAELNKTITILGFDKTTKLKDFNVSIYELLTNKSPRKIEVERVSFSNDEYHYLNIDLNENLFEKSNYQLNLNNKLRYTISDIEVYSEVRMIGSRKDSVCNTKAFKINNKDAEIIFNSGINFRKPN